MSVQVDPGEVATVSFATGEPGSRVGLDDLTTLLGAVLDTARVTSTRAVVLRGAPGTFCAGASERLLHELGTAPGRARLRDEVVPLLVELDDLPCLLVTAITGSAVGVGVHLALAGDVRVMARRARLLPGFARLGLPPEYSLAHELVSVMGRPRAIEFLLSSSPMSAQDALDRGLVNRIGDASAVPDLALGLADDLTRGVPRAQLRTTLELARAATSQTRRQSFDRSVSGMLAALEHRRPQPLERAELR